MALHAEEPDSAVPVYARAYGVTFRVHVADARLRPDVIARLPPGARLCRPCTSESFSAAITGYENAYQVLMTPESVHDLGGPGLSSGEALDTFESAVRFEVARRAARWTFVHAGVVGWSEQAILIPGPSFSGKSSLVAALVEAGATYYSDEYAVLDRRGVVYPFAQPLMRRTAAGTRDRLSVADLGGTLGTRALPVGAVVATRYEAGASWSPRLISPGEGVLALMSNTVRAQTAPARVMRVLARVTETAATLEGVRGEAAETAAHLLRDLDSWFSDRRNIA